jgi:MFS family permease
MAVGRRSIPFMLGMALYYLGANYVWTSYNSVVLPRQVELLFPVGMKSLVLGIIVGLSTAVGLVVNIFSGVRSHNVRLRWGRRRPYILIGALLASLALLVPALLPIAVITTVSSYFMMQLFTNFSAGAYQPLLPDIIQEDQRGETSGFQGLMTLSGSAMGFGLTGYLVGSGLLGDALISMAATFLFTALVTVRTIRRADIFPHGPTPTSVGAAVREMFRPRTVAIPFFWLTAGGFMIFMGSIGLTFFEAYYFEAILHITAPGAAFFAVAIAGLLVLLVAMVSALVFGYLSDRIGRKNLIIGAALVAGTAIFFVPFVTNFDLFLILACFVGGPLGVFNSVTYALASDLAPKDETGKYMAYWNLASGGAGVVAPIVDGVMLYVFGASSLPAFVALFTLSSLFYFAGAAVLSKMPRG